MQYEINTTRAKLKAEEINTLSGSIGRNVFNISALYVSLRLIGAPSIQYVVKRVQKQNAAIATEALRLGVMGRSLDRISTYYYNAENEVAGNRTVTGSVLNDIFFQRRHDASNSEMDELISKFEKEHPEYAKKLNDLLASGRHNKLTEDDIRKIKYLAYTAEEPYRSIYLRLLGKYRIGEGNLKKGAYYQPGEHTINFTYRNCFENDPRGEYTTFFHESGHAVDDLAELARQDGFDTDDFTGHSKGMDRDVTLREAIEYDVYYNQNNPHSVTSLANDIINQGRSGKNGNIDNVIEAFKQGSSDGLSKADRELYNAVRNAHQNECGGGESVEAVTDVYGGASKNGLQNTRNGRMGYTHKDSYWNDPFNTSRELWAEYFSYNMAGNTDALNNVREYFPEAVQILDQYAEQLGGK